MFNPLERAKYVLAAHLPSQLPADVGHEVAFAGRSNAGKSTALNALTRQNSLARVSKTPGRTQQLVFFEVEQDKYLVDLPGYGYAKVPHELKDHWQAFLDRYFRSRECAQGPGRGHGHPPPAQGIRPAHAQLCGGTRHPRPRAADQGRQAGPRPAGQYPAGGEEGAVRQVRRHGQRADLLRRVEAGRGRGARGGERVAGVRRRTTRRPECFAHGRRARPGVRLHAAATGLPRTACRSGAKRPLPLRPRNRRAARPSTSRHHLRRPPARRRPAGWPR